MKVIRWRRQATRLGPLGVRWIAIVLIASMVSPYLAWAGVEEWERLSTSAIEAYQQARFVAAEAALKAALDEAEQSLGAQHVIVSLENLGELYRRTERYREAESMHRRALRIAETR